FMDELAVAAGQDPLEYRLALLEKKQPRYWAVLRAAAREARYGQLAKGHRHGVAVMEGYGTYMAQIADCSIENGKLRVHHIYCAVDCGQAVHPNNIVAQVESSIIFGLSAALWGQIDIAAGRVQQTNFDRYRTLRLPEIPKITTYLTDSAEPPGGIGEPATALVAPAVGNALYMLTGKRVRSLPFARHGYA
ncbi:MAG: molybdopterin-dependent oxidoreductase, partial [Steroidobacteraceae bacterium]|nr:molybdopterin-dependent oxidoreductase [Steroidobacteraceae bacterium]MDW8258193.1 aldehyde oxidase [Gammaproteobacteria bacterium]